MCLTYYIYAIIAIMYLSKNDPWHFKSVEISMITLFRVATLDGWGDAMFISYHGCHEYGWDVYTDDPDEANEIKVVDWDGGLTRSGTSPKPAEWKHTDGGTDLLFNWPSCPLSQP